MITVCTNGCAEEKRLVVIDRFCMKHSYDLGLFSCNSPNDDPEEVETCSEHLSIINK